MRFDNKTILVTGAAGGIGAATVRRLLAEGANIAAADNRKLELDKLLEELQPTDQILGMEVDTTNREQVGAFVDAARRHFGNLYGLVNSAGIRGVGSVLDLDPANWQHVIRVNLEGTFNVCQFFSRALTQMGSKGAVVNLSSAAGIRGVANRLAYAGSKYGVIGISQTMALELGPMGIRVNAIVPGMIRTPMTEPMFADPENAARIRAAHPIGREGQPEEVAASIAFLLSEEASFITGTILAVDGGQTAGIASH